MDICIFHRFPRKLLDPGAFENCLSDFTDRQKLAVWEVEGQVQGRSESSLQRFGGRIEIGTVLAATLEMHASDRFKVI